MATIDLTDQEALVMVEFLSRYSNDDVLEVRHQAEQRVLWDMCCILEKQVAELFDLEYSKKLDEARNQVADASIE